MYETVNIEILKKSKVLTFSWVSKTMIKSCKLFFLNPLIPEFNITSEDFTSDDRKLLLYHRFLEAGKFAFALRSHLGDEPESPTVRKVRTNIVTMF